MVGDQTSSLRDDMYKSFNYSWVKEAEFEKVEIKPQAIEWILSASCGFRFQVSCDNLSGTCEPDRVGSTNKVWEQVLVYLVQGIPERIRILSEASLE